MCHHYDSDRLANWEREFETEEDETPDEPELDVAEDDDVEREDREPATPPADD